MLGSLGADQLGLVLKQLQLIDILAVFALACTAWDMHALVWTWLRDQSVLQVDKLLRGSPTTWRTSYYYAIFMMTQMVRARLSGSLRWFRVGKSFYCIDGECKSEIGERVPFMFLDEKGAVEDVRLAQFVLPFFQDWYYCINRFVENSTLLQRVRASGLYLGDIGAASAFFALRNLDTSAVHTLDFECCGLTDVGAKELAGLMRELPALTLVFLARNHLSAQGKRAISRACRHRLSNVLQYTPALQVVYTPCNVPALRVD
tara:strand:- start:306 stop:1085 length:780 start_codon:yes stop_codon:yes gene_type:complete